MVPREATFECESRHYYKNNNITINGVDKSNISLRITSIRCDSIEECHDGLDELDCESEIINIPHTLLIIALLTLASIASPKSLKRCLLKSVILSKSVKLRNIIGTETNSILNQMLQVKHKKDLKTLLKDNCHKNDEIGKALIAIHYIQMPRKVKKDLYVLYYKTELRLHQRNRAEAYLCIKNQGLISIAEQIFDDYKPGVMRRAQPKWVKDRGS